MSETKLSLGKAIDQVIEALSSFDEKDRKAIVTTVCSHLQIEFAPPTAAPQYGEAAPSQARSDVFQ